MPFWNPFTQPRDQHRHQNATRVLHRALMSSTVWDAERHVMVTNDPLHREIARTVEQVVRDGADLTEVLDVPHHQLGVTPLGLAVANDAWWLQKVLLAAFSSEQPALAAVFNVPYAEPGMDIATGRRTFLTLDEHGPLFLAMLIRAQRATLQLLEQEPVETAALDEVVSTVTAWVHAGAYAAMRVTDGMESRHGLTLLQRLVLADPFNVPFAQWPLDLLSNLDVQAVDTQEATVLHTLWQSGATEASAWAFARLVHAGADPHRTDLEGDSALHRMARLLAVGAIKPKVLQTLMRLLPDLDVARPNTGGESLMSIIQKAATPLLGLPKAKACWHVLAPQRVAWERTELEVALQAARPPANPQVALDPVLMAKSFQGLNLDLPGF